LAHRKLQVTKTFPRNFVHRAVCEIADRPRENVILRIVKKGATAELVKNTEISEIVKGSFRPLTSENGERGSQKTRGIEWRENSGRRRKILEILVDHRVYRLGKLCKRFVGRRNENE